MLIKYLVADAEENRPEQYNFMEHFSIMHVQTKYVLYLRFREASKVCFRTHQNKTTVIILKTSTNKRQYTELIVYKLSFPLMGQCHEIFDFKFSLCISFPQAPEYIIRVVSNFFENLRRYSQLKVHHRRH